MMQRLHKIACCGVFASLVWAIPQPAPAAPIAGEDFGGAGYTDGAALGGLNGGSGWAGAWTGSASDTIVTTGLTYARGAAVLAAGGGKLQFVGGAASRFVATGAGSPAQSAGVVDASGNIGADGTSVWVNPTPGTVPSDASRDLFGSTGDWSFDRITFSGGAATTLEFDELRIGTSYADLQPTFLPLTGREDQILGAHIMEWETPYEVEVPAMRLSMPALGEPTWNQESTPRRNWENFLVRQTRTDALYERVMRPVTVSVSTQVDPRDGCFTAGGMVTMASPVAGTIRYTVGTDYKNSWYDFPSNASTEYTGPFPITQSSVISARLFDASGNPLGNPVTRGFYLITPRTHYKYFFTGDTPAPDFETGTPIVNSVMGRMDGNASHEDVRFGDTKHRTIYTGALETAAGSYTFNANFAGGAITIDREPVANGVPVSLAAGEHLVKIVTPASGLGTPYTFSGPGHGAGSDINLLLKTLDTASGLPGGFADASLSGTAEAATVQVTNLTDGETLRYSLVLVDGTYDGQSLQITAAPAGTALSFTTTGDRFRCLVDLQPGTNTLTITDGQGPATFDLVFTPPTSTDYRYKIWYVVPSDEAGSPADPDWFTHFGLQAKLMQSWMAEDQWRAGNGRATLYPELDASHNVDVGLLVVSQTRAQAEALGTGMYGQVWNQLPAAYKDGRHKNLAFSSVAFNALGGGDLCYVGAYTGIHPADVAGMMDALLSTQVSPSGPLTYSTYTGVTLHEMIHTLHSIWHDSSAHNIMGGGGYDISQYFTLTYSDANPAPHNESGAGTLGVQRDLAAWNRYLMSADPQVYGNTTVNVTTGPEYLAATSQYPLAVFQYYIPSSAADLSVNLAASPVTTFSMHAGEARLELGGHPFNVMAVDTEGNMSYATFAGTPVPVVPVDDTYLVNGTGATVIAASGVLGNEINPSGSTLTAVLATDVVHGTLDLDPDGGFTYTPGPGFAGTDSFCYTVVDAVSSDRQACVTLTADPAAATPAAIGWNYRGVGGVGLAPDDLAGAPGFEQDHWNNHPGAGQGPGSVPFALAGDNGNTTTAQVTAWTLSMNNSWQHNQTANPDEVLMNDFSDKEPAITFSGIPYTSYDLVVYYGNNEGPSTSTLAITGAVDDARSRSIRTGNTAQSSHRSAGYLEETRSLTGPTNFTVFTGLDDAETTVSLAGANNNGISAIQILNAVPPLSGFALWQAVTPGAGSSFDSNNDGDAWVDLVEYALGGDPATGLAPPGLPAMNDAGGSIDLVCSRPTGIADVLYALEGSLNGSNWFTITDRSPSITTNSGTETLTYTGLDLTADVPGIATSPVAMFRLRFTLL